MKIALLITALFLTIPHLSLAADSLATPEESMGLPQACQEITEKCKIYEENWILADEKRETKHGFYGKGKEDSYESKQLREKCHKIKKELQEMIETLVLVDAQILAKNLALLPRGVVVEREGLRMTEPMTFFDDFTNLGAGALILNSLRDNDHPNFTRYSLKEKQEMTTKILNFSSAMAKIGSEFLQPSYSPNGFLFQKSVDVNRLASHLLKEDFQEK